MKVKEIYELAVKNGCENAEVFFSSNITNNPIPIYEAFVWHGSGMTDNPKDKIFLLR